MKNLHNVFARFYGKHVVLPKTEKSSLFQKKNLNIVRLKAGLQKYNEEKGTSYKLAEEPIVQGSVAMSTVTQNESNDYDIDVAIVFEKDGLPDGTTATKNMIENALRKNNVPFKTPPTAKTNCVRIEYEDGYHIDFAVYRRYKKNEQDDEYVYEHCGSQWRERNPRTITSWFLEANKEKDYKLREVVRLLKMFSKSRSWWKNMPGGLIQSVLANEQFREYERLDECFYYTLQAIKDRLVGDTEVYNPTDSTTSLKLVSKDDTKMTNLYTRLNNELAKLDVLFEEDCTNLQAIEAWEAFFNHSYWTKKKAGLSKVVESASFEKSFSTFSEEPEGNYRYRESEEFIQYMLPVNEQPDYFVNLNAKVIQQNGKTAGWLQTMIKQKQALIPGYTLDFRAITNVPAPYSVYWKVKNRGEKAKENDAVRGQIFRTDGLTHSEPTAFAGNHYVECYIVKNGVCVVRKRIAVDIKG
ncbi:nucleotide-binding domain-containing protein [Metabacillus idriensis]|uniref:nucleotide-binding domain-containing protein n=1 Tax=Metabacillus idriensis TaxID=324768 RepID=UPI0017488B19|nr:nucleotidyltransferase [Metabacillus idriensis]